MHDKMIKTIRGEKSFNDFFDEWCSAQRFHAWQEEFGMYLDLTSFPFTELYMGGYYYAKKYGGPGVAYQIWMYLDLITGRLYPVLKFSGIRAGIHDMCLLDYSK